MTEVRAGSVRAVKPRGLRSTRAKLLLPIAGAAAVVGIALVAVAQGPGTASAPASVPSVAEIAQAEAQGYESSLLTADGAAYIDQGVTDTRGGETFVVTVTTPTPEPKPSENASSGEGADSAPSADPGSAQAIAQQMVADRGWGSEQYDCLYSLYDRESGWNVGAENSSSGAYGIPQALPGDKMASHGGDWRTNPATQIAWGLDYISGRYGTPCGAWGHSESVGWY